GHVHPLGEGPVVGGHLRDRLEQGLLAIGLLRALLALGTQLGGTLLHRSTLLRTEPVTARRARGGPGRSHGRLPLDVAGSVVAPTSCHEGYGARMPSASSFLTG